MAALKQGCAYALRSDPSRRGIVMSVDWNGARWAEMVPDWPFPAPPVLVRQDDLVRVRMRDSRGDFDAEALL